MESACVNLIRETLFTLANATEVPKLKDVKDLVNTFPNLEDSVKQYRLVGVKVDFFLKKVIDQVNLKGTKEPFLINYGNKLHHFKIVGAESAKEIEKIKKERKIVKVFGDVKFVEHSVFNPHKKGENDGK